MHEHTCPNLLMQHELLKHPLNNLCHPDLLSVPLVLLTAAVVE